MRVLGVFLGRSSVIPSPQESGPGVFGGTFSIRVGALNKMGQISIFPKPVFF